MRLRYRSDIDGLRALAVLAVIVFHTFPKLLPGGFVGVDIFFVISGYLITQIILFDVAAHLKPLTRAWELMTGAAIAQTAIQDRRHDDLFAAIGIAAIALSLFLINEKTPLPGWAAAVPVVGTALLIRAEGSFLNGSVLSSSAAVNVGVISYPLYLWRWPLLVFAEMLKFKRSPTSNAD